MTRDKPNLPVMKEQITLVGAAGACFSKVLRTFWAQKASYQTSIPFFWKAELSTCFCYNKNREHYEVWWPRTLVLWRYKGNCGTRNFRTFEKQPLETKIGKYCCLPVKWPPLPAAHPHYVFTIVSSPWELVSSPGKKWHVKIFELKNVMVPGEN